MNNNIHLIIIAFFIISPCKTLSTEASLLLRVSKFREKILTKILNDRIEIKKDNIKNIIFDFKKILQKKHQLDKNEITHILANLYHTNCAHLNNVVYPDESITTALLKSPGNNQQFILADLLKCGYLNQLDSTLLAYAGIYVQTTIVIKNIIINIIEKKQQLSHLLESIESKLSSDTQIKYFIKDNWQEIALIMIETFAVKDFKHLISIISNITDELSINIQKNKSGDIYIDDSIFTLILKNMYLHSKFIQPYLKENRNIIKTINKDIIYKRTSATDKKSRAFNYLQLVKMRNIYFKFIGEKFLHPSIKKGSIKKIYIFFTYINSGQSYLSQVNPFSGIKKILLFKKKRICLLKEVLVLKNSLMLSLFLHLIKKHISYYDRDGNNLFHLVFIFNSGKYKNIKDLDLCCLYLLRILLYSKNLKKKYITAALKAKNNSGLSPLELCSKEGMMASYHELKYYLRNIKA